MVYSSSYIFSQEKYGDGLFYFNRHLLFLCVGFSATFFFRFLSIKRLHQFSHIFFIATLFLMALALVPGVQQKAGGASRWINILGFSLQPIEFAKVAFVLMISRMLTSEKFQKDDLVKGFLVFFIPTGLLIGLCLAQPDFGSAALVIAVATMLLYMGRVRLKFLLGAAAAIVPVMGLLMVLAPYRRARLLTFLDPWADPQGSGFQIIQSFIAFYRGGLFGVGLGNSKAKVFYLPEAHNDFILSVIGEELGWIGIALLVMSFLFLLFRGIRISAKAKEPYTALVVAGLTLLIGMEVFWNAFVVLGLFPTKGMNMPFISSGGTSILCALMILGILLNASSRIRESN
ncbi:MAG: putative lipid II flippase FtsW [Oligoflexia bacterium]|nr:putative lipid II flippase FtsW [Oligoflexia bacterium]